MRLIRIIFFAGLLFLQLAIISIIYNKWFDTLDMIKYNITFGPEEYYNRPTKLKEYVIFYTIILFFAIVDFLYLKKIIDNK